MIVWPQSKYKTHFKHSLNKHILKHTAQKQYKYYNYCNKSFSIKSNLIKHKLIDTSIKKYSCDWNQCYKQFKTNI